MPLQPIRRIDPPWLSMPQLRAALDCLHAAGYEARVVGGAIRDTFTHDTARSGTHRGPDIDIATTAQPHAVLEAAANAGLETRPTGIAHGTITILSGGIPFETTTLRSDRNTDGRHAEVVFSTDWKADAERRDLTINALYCDRDGHLYDPVNGVADLEAGILRFIGNPHQRLREDYLRTLRFYRFHAVLPHFTCDPASVWATTAEHAGLARLSAERVHKELTGLFAAPGALKAVTEMVAAGVFGKLLPSVAHLKRLERVICLEQELGQKADPILRLAGVCLSNAADGERLSRHLKLSRHEQNQLAQISAQLTRHQFPPETDVDARQLLYRQPANMRPALAIFAEANAPEAAHKRNWAHLHTLAANWSPPDFPVTARDLIAIGHKPGPALGEQLRILETTWCESDFALDRAALLQRANPA